MNDIRQRFERLLDENPTELSSDGLVAQGIAVLLHLQTVVDIERDIIEFHKKMLVPYDGPPRLMPKDHKGREKHMKEELKELMDAIESGDLEKIYDAYIDIIYLSAGNLYLMGLRFSPGWRAVHKSNMTKEPIELGTGKNGTTVYKGEAYVPPNLKEILYPNEQTNNS